MSVATMIPADITCGPDSNLESLLREFVSAKVDKNESEHRLAPDYFVEASHEQVAVDVTLLTEELQDQYDWLGTDESKQHKMTFYADFVRVENEADRVLAIYKISVSPKEYPGC